MTKPEIRDKQIKINNKYFKGIFVNLHLLKPADKFRWKASLLRGDDGSSR